jgi:hypothetical protein
MPKTLLKDSFEFESVPFIVKAETRQRFVNWKTREMEKLGGDISKKSGDRKTNPWVLCEMVLVRVRPDYPYSVEKEWPENVDMHFSTIVPIDVPKKESVLFIVPKYTTERKQNIEDVKLQKAAEATIQKMKSAYENREKVATLER